MRMGLEMRMSQQLIMTPQLQQAIKLLQLSRTELEELIDQALVENPTLEVPPVEKDDESAEEKESAKKEAENLVDEQSQLSYDDEWQSYIESGGGVIREVRNHNVDTSDDSNPLEATVSKSNTLADHLFWQLDISEFSDNEKEIAEHIIGNIDDEGYLAITIRELLASTPLLLKQVISIQEMNTLELPPVGEHHRFDIRHESSAKVEKKKRGKAKKMPVDLDGEEEVESLLVELEAISDNDCNVVELVLRKIQTFDPPGVGTRDLQECLENQLKVLKIGDSLAFRIISENMQYLEQKDLKRIARLQKADINEVVKAHRIITELEPKPGRPFGKEVTQYVIPDVFIYKRGSEYIVHMNQENMPKLRINPHYQTIAKNSKEDKPPDKAAKNDVDSDMTYLYLQEKIKAGEWLMKSIEQRQKTIFRVAKSILKYQYEFFEKGIDFLKPLVLKDVAEDIEVHESTVSRITTNKYVYTPQGIFELKYFFTSGIDQGDGDVVSSKKIKDYIKKLVDAEDKRKPCTDLQIKNRLAEGAGIKVARRTVAKYREAMNILPSNKRKQLY
ncbi:MAG: RNA polymerase factor sigma-54 [Proteobacteria bacterium]|nr:RNA polymerase factor sigma-54 [Pseudomonadota bacterium]